MFGAAAGVLAAAAGLVLGDLVAATFHWAEDNYLAYCADAHPFLARLARDNELHHFFPRAIVRYSWWENSANSVAIAAVLLAVYACCCGPRRPLVHLLVLSGLAAAAAANVFHKWSHMRDCEVGPLLLGLRRAKVLCDHDYHSRHHARPESRYNVIFRATGLLSDPLHALLERLVFAALGVRPDRFRGLAQESDRWTGAQWHAHVSACPSVPSEAEVALAEETLLDTRQSREK
jgi:hypothetical protein